MSKRLTRVVLSLLFLVLSLVYSHYKTVQTDPKTTVATSVESFATSSPQLVNGHIYTVERVVDGDTVVLANGQSTITVRLVGVDTPEIVAPHKPVQCFGKEASNEAHTLLDKQMVRFESDPTQDQYDKYGRTLGYLFLPDGRNFAEIQIDGGFGKEYTYKKAYQYQKEFKNAEGQAKARGLGLWSACTQ